MRPSPESSFWTARSGAVLLAVFAAAAARLFPHPPNFTPVMALALFSGATIARGIDSLVAPLLALLVSDVVLGFYGAGMLFVYDSVVLAVGLGRMIAGKPGWLRVAWSAVAASILFFLVTNFGVWALETLYPKNLAGLADCYLAAIPFFRNELASNLFYCTLLFGGFALLERLFPALRAPERAQPA